MKIAESKGKKDTVYSDIVRDHFAHPRNVGEIENPDAVGEAKNRADGDVVQLHLSVHDGKIKDIKMKVMGCVAAIAATSMLTEMVKSKSIEEALSISREELSCRLGGLPDNKMQCSLTCITALHRAIGQVKKTF